MDMAAVPRITSIVLTGLDFSMKPELARYETARAYIKPFPELKVMHQIKSLAIMVYNQEKMTPYYHGNVCDGRNTLAYFICAVHRQQAPQPQTHTRQGSVASTSSNSSKKSCKSAKNCELPKLVVTSMLPLGYWDSLYYALVAEIRTLHNDLQVRFGFGCELGTAPMHYSGPDGTTDQPVTAIDFASMLETAWYALMDNRLVVTLDDAVRMKQMHEATAEHQPRENRDIDEAGVSARPPILYGLIDINALTPDYINTLLWEKHAPEIDRACLENFEDESMLTAYRAELHNKRMADGIAVSTPLPSAMPCICHRACVCKLKCDDNAEGCTCVNKVHIYHQVTEQEAAKSGLQARYVKADGNRPNPFLGAATNSLAQMQIAALANPDSTTYHASNKAKSYVEDPDQSYSNTPSRAPSNVDHSGWGSLTSDPASINHSTYSSLTRTRTNTDQSMISSLGRVRTNTNNSELAYVPPSRAATYRSTKDTVPLGFYGRDSGQRYPTMRTQTPGPSSEDAPSYTMPPSTMKPVNRKPVPTPIVPPMPSFSLPQVKQNRPSPAITPQMSSPFEYKTFDPAEQDSYHTIAEYQADYQAGQVKYPSIPKSKSHATITQSFPESGASNPRSVYDDDETPIKPKGRKQSFKDPAEDYIDLLSRHPSTTDYPTEPFPTLSRPTTNSPPGQSNTSRNLQALKSLLPRSNTMNNVSTSEKPHPPLPLAQPDFIAPRPALKQRYVSAGGDVPMSEREEVAAPPRYGTTMGGHTAINKDNLDRYLENAEWVRNTFGEEAVAVASPERTSSSALRESIEGGASTPEVRDRRTSSSARRVVKRLWPRKGSESAGNG